ncbi:unnamed protein product [Heterobilharzia americana]|nr:unnamed protein product [Heterobilharzia americana]
MKSSCTLPEDDLKHDVTLIHSSKKSDFVYIRMKTPSQIQDEYELGSILGEGSFGIVYYGLKKADGSKCAIKKISRENSFSASERARLDREISILRHVRHPGIIKLLAVAESPKIVFLITELCEGNSLDHCIKQLPEKSVLQEYIVAAIVRQVASALSYLHNRGIIHRDLKLGNIMLLNKVELDFRNDKTIANCKSLSIDKSLHKTNNKDVDHEVKYPPRGLHTKLIDFGLAIEVRKNEEALANPCGTPLYMAPEVLNGRSYTRQCDLWSLGILMFILLTNQSPFTSHSEEQLIDELNNLNIQNTIESLGYVTSLGQECLVRLLTIDPAYRSSANELLLDPWLSYYPMCNPDEIIDTMDNSTRTSNDTLKQEVYGQLGISTVHSLVDFSKGSLSLNTSRPSSFSRFQSAGQYSTTNVLELMKQYHKELNDCKQENEKTSESEHIS